MITPPSEDKTCRMCGYADQSNLNIFKTRQCNKQILALYPIVLYKSDPLPKNICLKCYSNTLRRYDEYLRISKIQTKWITNVRNNQPNNPYIRILDKIEDTNRNLLDKLKKMGDDSLDESFSIITHNRGHFPEDILPRSFTSNKQNYSQEDKQTFSNHPSNSVLLSHLKGERIHNTDLKSNGFTSNKSMHSTRPKPIDFAHFPKNKCRYCFKLLANQKSLAFHQVKQHFGLSVFKSFTKKSLPKRLRCGQAIKINNKACLRCNNCWKCFDNYDSILNHWQNKRCEFYCLVCGKEYPNDPSLLRNHIKSKHVLNCKAYKHLHIKSKIYQSTMSSHSVLSLKQNSMLPDLEMRMEESLCSLDTDFEKESIEFDPLDMTEKPKIPVLKLKRKTNSERGEFDIKVENLSNSPPLADSPNSISNKSEPMGKPLLRVKNISELQCQPKIEPDEYDSLDDLSLQTLNLQKNSESLEHKFSDEVESINDVQEY